MDKNVLSNDKIIELALQDGLVVHKSAQTASPFQRAIGLWIIAGAADFRTKRNGFACTRQRRYEFFSLSHLLDGRGKFWCENGTEQIITPGTVAIVTPGTINRYGGWGDEPYIEDFVCFAGPVADGWKRAGLICDGFVNFGFERRLLPIIELARDPSNDAQVSAAMQLQNVLLDIHLRRRNASMPDAVEQVIAEIKKHPETWWTVEELARQCNWSVSQFRRNFMRHTGMLPKEYIEESKLRHSAELLLSSSLTVREIALRFGYRDPFHFSRRFKHRFGVSPESYRSSGGVNMA